MTNEDIAVLILDWAKEKHPEKYAQTLEVAAIPRTFRRYLLRLVEIRWEQEPEWRGSVPVKVLDETAIVQKMKVKDTGQVLEVKGQLSPKPHITRWQELALSKEDFLALQDAKNKLDLEYVYD